MSTRTYNLRTRVEAGLNTQSRIQNEPASRGLSPSPTRDVPPHMTNYRLLSASPALYSDVVAERSPSPLKEKTLAPLTSSAEEVEVVGSPIGISQPSVHVVPPVSMILSENNNVHTSSEVNASQKEPEEPSWTTVKRRRVRSLDSSDLAKESQLESKGQRGLTRDQVQTVKVAAEAMTKSQKTLVDNRNKKIPHRRGDSSSSREEGPSRRKGKGIDPREWGNVNISQESLDVDAQAAA